MNSITRAMGQVKDQLPRLIEHHVLDFLASSQWRGRVRELDPLTTVLLFICQIMHRNTAINHLRHVAAMTCSAAAFCKARQRLPLALLEHISKAVTRDVACASDEVGRWRGHRVWKADMTGCSMPDTPALQAHFGQPTGQQPGCGFPVASLLILCNAAGFIMQTLVMPLQSGEAGYIPQLHKSLKRNDLLIYDRAGCSYAQLALGHLRSLHAIFRMHQKQIVSFRSGRKHAGEVGKNKRKGLPRTKWLKRLGRCDQLVCYFKPIEKPRWMSQQQHDTLPASLVLRELRYAAKRRGFRSRSITLLTTLLDPQSYPAEELAEQYLSRWEIETNFRHLKQTMNMDVLKCKTVDGVKKELAVFILVYNLVRLVMLRASRRQDVPLDRISFIDALRWLCDGAFDRDLIVNPKRTGRVEPRVVKRRMKEYRWMKQPRSELREQLMGKTVRD